MIETTAIGDSAASYMPTGQEEETTEGDQEAVEQLRSLLGEPGEIQESPVIGPDKAAATAKRVIEKNSELFRRLS